MGESVTEGMVSRWLKGVGDSVDEGEPLVEVTTDKVDVEVPSPASGQLSEIVAAEGETVAVGAVLGVIAPGTPAAKTAAPPDPPATSAVEPSSAPPPAPAEEPPVPSPETPAVAADGAGVEASPLARRAAAHNGVDLHTVHGSGPGGIVTKGDVLAATAAPAPTRDATIPVTDGEAEPIRGPAAALVDYMERSRDIPTATSFRTVGVRVLDARRRQLNDALALSGKPAKVSFTHLIGYAIARAAGASPAMTAHFARTAEGKPARVPGPAHLGLAVDSVRKDGTRFLVVPVIRDASR